MRLVNLIHCSVVAAKSIQKLSQLVTKCLTRPFRTMLPWEYSGGTGCLRELETLSSYFRNGAGFGVMAHDRIALFGADGGS